ncbi:hypothetical protein Tco_0980832 [Tanacetum coccineum]
MNTNEQTPVSQPTSVVRNTLEKEQVPQDSGRPASDAALREYCDMNYHQILPIIAEKMHQEKVQQEKLKAVKARLNFEEASQHSESGTLSRRRDLKKRLGSRHKEKRCSIDWRMVYSTGSETWGRIHLHTQTIQGIDHATIAAEILKVATRVLAQERQNSLLRNIITKEHPHKGRKHSKKCIKDPVEIHNIRQGDGESTEEFVRRCKLECKDVKGVPKCMKIYEIMHGITNLELIKRLHDKILKSIDGMMRVTTAFLRGDVAASNHERKKSFPSWKQQEAGQKQNFKNGGFRNQQRPKRKQDRFTLLTKTPKEILALDKGKFKPPPPMTTPVEKRNASKFSEAKQWKRLGKGNKKGGNLKKGQAAGDTDGTTVAKGSQTKDYSNFLSGVSHFFPTYREKDETEGPMIIEVEIGGHCVHRMYVDGGSSSEILGKVTLSLQWNYREAGGKEDQGSSIHSPQNAKILSDWWNGHITEQQDHSTRMHNGFRTRGTAARNQPSHRRKDSGGNPPGISGTSYSDRLHFDRRRVKGAMWFAKAQS